MNETRELLKDVVFGLKKIVGISRDGSRHEEVVKEIKSVAEKQTIIVDKIVSSLEDVGKKVDKIKLEIPKSQKVEVLNQIKVPESVEVKKPSWLFNFKTIASDLIDYLDVALRGVFNVRIDQNPKRPNEYVNVRLTNSKEFYEASGGGDGIRFGPPDNQDVSITEYGDTPNFDAFGRFRVSHPQTLFDSKNVFDDPTVDVNLENQPLFYDNAQISGSGTGTVYNVNQASQSLSVSANTAGVRVRQTKMRFNYQPGKSQLIDLSFAMSLPKTGIVQREGVFDEKNGIFLEAYETIINVCLRSYVTGSAVDIKVPQASWNIDKLDGNGESGITLDVTKTNILMIDYEWLGVGRVRVGFNIGGRLVYIHQFNHANINAVVYMATPNLPLRSEIQNLGTGAASSLTQICSTVISEGGSEHLGVIRYASTEGTHVDANVENTVYAVLGMRLKSAYIGASVRQLYAGIQLQTASHKVEWVVLLNPTVAGTFTYVGKTNSAVEIAKGALANTVTGGLEITGGFLNSEGVASGGAGSGSRELDNAILLGSKIDGTVDEIVLCVRPIAGSTNVDVEGMLNWRELL